MADIRDRSEYNRRWYAANREAVIERRRQFVEANHEVVREQMRKAGRRYDEAHREERREATRRYREANHETVLERKRSQREANRAKVLAHYSVTSPPSCACCGTTDRLTIDHVNGGGRQHRMEVIGSPGRSHDFYAWLIRENFPAGFAVLCLPCNASKSNGERCRMHAEVTCV